MFLTPHKEGEFTAVDVFLFHDTKNVYSLETNDVESRSDFDDALQDKKTTNLCSTIFLFW